VMRENAVGEIDPGPRGSIPEGAILNAVEMDVLVAAEGNISDWYTNPGEIEATHAFDSSLPKKYL